MFGHLLPSSKILQQPSPPSSASSSSSTNNECELSARFLRPQSGFDSTRFSHPASANHSLDTPNIPKGPNNAVDDDLESAADESLNHVFKFASRSAFRNAEDGLEEMQPPSRLDEANPYRDSSMSFRYLHPASTLDSTTDSFAQQEDQEVCMVVGVDCSVC